MSQYGLGCYSELIRQILQLADLGIGSCFILLVLSLLAAWHSIMLLSHPHRIGYRIRSTRVRIYESFVSLDCIYERVPVQVRDEALQMPPRIL